MPLTTQLPLGAQERSSQQLWENGDDGLPAQARSACVPVQNSPVTLRTLDGLHLAGTLVVPDVERSRFFGHQIRLPID